MVVESVRVHTALVAARRHPQGRRPRPLLPIWIGVNEADAIARRLQGITPERHLTHDLFASTLGGARVAVKQVIVSDLSDETIPRAASSLDSASGPSTSTARPCDAIALAIPGRCAHASPRTRVLDRAGSRRSRTRTSASPVFREFVNSLEDEVGAQLYERLTGVARAEDRLAALHSDRSAENQRRRRRRQKSRTARSTTLRVGARGLASRPRVVWDADFDQAPAREHGS
jgi:bifunctional DNase/RNase